MKIKLKTESPDEIYTIQNIADFYIWRMESDVRELKIQLSNLVEIKTPPYYIVRVHAQLYKHKELSIREVQQDLSVAVNRALSRLCSVLAHQQKMGNLHF